jgi:hypothetical protein
VQTNVNVRRFARTVAAMATTALGLGVLTSPAQAATGPTATLSQGTVTVSGTGVRDLIGVAIDADRLTVDFGHDGTVDAQFQRSQFQQVQVLAREGNDGVSVTGTGAVRVTISGGAGADGMGVLGNIGESGANDAPATLSGDGGNDNLLAATPGPVTVLGGAGDDRVDGGGAGIGQERIALGDGNDRYLPRSTPSSAPETTPSMVGPDRTP